MSPTPTTHASESEQGCSSSTKKQNDSEDTKLRQLSDRALKVMQYKSNPDSVFKKAAQYHKLKREILAPFVARLLIRHKLDSLLKGNGSEENDTIMESSDEDDGSTATISTTVVVSRDDGTGSESGASYQDDCGRNRSPLPFSESD